jgi:hypothetical protein
MQSLRSFKLSNPRPQNPLQIGYALCIVASIAFEPAQYRTQ